MGSEGEEDEGLGNYELGITNYELRITNYELRIGLGKNEMAFQAHHQVIESFCQLTALPYTTHGQRLPFH
jgi:hypothetical protein